MGLRRGTVPAAAPSAAESVDVCGPDWIVDPLRNLFRSVRLAETLPRLEVTVTGDGRWAACQVNGAELWSIPVHRGRWLEALTGQITATMTSLLQRLLFVHAGAVELGGRACLVVGSSGSGKTSTVAALLARGAAYLSDEVALLDPENGTISPFHIPMAIKPWTAKAAGTLPDGIDAARQGPVHFHLPALRGRSCPIGAVVMLERGRGGELARIPPAEALIRIARQPSSFQYAARTEAAFLAWVAALRRAECFEIRSDQAARLAPTIADMMMRNVT
ncbi:MAG TPA: hypothetical protein VJT33_17925 [bacterium]|nr:hypothetical protein [bacterium]